MPEPRDVVTGEVMPQGPIRLAPHQKRIINEALSKKDNGDFKYSTVIFSAPKKSGKSAIASAVILYMAYHNSYSFLACMANDGKQSADRLYRPIYDCINLHKQLGGILENEKPRLESVTLSNSTKIEAVTVDAAGEAGSQPLMSVFSELWGYTTEKKKRLWTEMTIPPTLHGRAIRWVETYAGYTGQSELLEQLYETGFVNAEPHPDFLDMQGRDGPVVRRNLDAGIFTYWDTEPRMVWQTPEYYVHEEAMHPPSEFRRIHKNEWVSAMDSFIQVEWWNACESDIPPLREGSDTPCVVGIDMATTRDCAALVLVTRHPQDPLNKVAVRAVRIFRPSDVGGVINQELLIRPVIEEWSKKYNVVCWAYDPHEMAKLAQDMTREGHGWFNVFSQQGNRAIADKHLHDMIVQRQVAWNRKTTQGNIGEPGTNEESLYKHLIQAGAKIAGDSYRLEKLSDSAKIDGAVALSMATYRAMKLAIDNIEQSQDHIIKKLQKGEISYQEFVDQLAHSAPKNTVEELERALNEYSRKNFRP